MRNPPKSVEWLLAKLLRPELLKGVYGDLLEEYHSKNSHTKWKADLWFLLSGLGFVRFPILFKTRNYQRNPFMNTWKNYFKISFRSLRRNKANTAISVLGLVVSFTSCMAILQYVRFEKSYDSFQGSNLYRVSHEMTSSATVAPSAVTFYGARDDFMEQIPGIESATHLMPAGNSIIRMGERVVDQENIIFATPDLFDVFQFPIEEGRIFDRDDPNAIVISRSVADRWFPDGDALDQIVEVDGLFGFNWNPKIVAIYEDLPANTHLEFSMIIPMQKLIFLSQEGNFFGPNFTFEQVRWLWLSFHTYLKLDQGADPEKVTEIANGIVAKNRQERNALLNQSHEVWLQPIHEIHTTAGIGSEIKPVNDNRIINLFAIVAICILLIGWINYINLSTARSVNRGKEVGIRKVLGSNVIQLKTQFQLEAFLINSFSFLLSVALLLLVAPLLEGITDVAFFSTLFTNYSLFIWVFVGVVVGSFLSGYYPSQVLANFKSIEILKGKLKHSSKGVALRRILVGLQFVFTLFLMSGLMIVHNQMQHMLNMDLGMDISQTVIINAPPQATPDAAYTSKMSTLRTTLGNLAGVQDISIGSMTPGLPNGWRVSTEDSDSERSGVFVMRSLIDHNYFDLYGIERIAGRLFEESYGSEASNVIVNVNTTQRLGFSTPEEAIDYDLRFAGETYKVVGVVDDFYQRGAQFAIEPMIFNLDTALVGGFLAMKVSNDQLSGLLPKFESEFQKAFPRAPFESRLVEDVYAAQYNNEQRFRTLFSLFTSIATIIAVLGLLGLASFLLNQRLKEICVRKVLGAKSSGLFIILNKEYLLINLVSFAIAIPIAVYLMQDWLAGFENRIQLGATYFLIPLVATIVIVLISTVNQTMKVINTNPAKILKEDD